MGYMASWNANKVIDLEQQEAPTAEQIEALQLPRKNRQNYRPNKKPGAMPPVSRGNE